jgi:ATP-binding cassette subfamily C protein LapB
MTRALVGRPPIIILDEPTSSVDTNTEARLMENLRKEFDGRTLLVITHRPSLLRVVDRVILLSRGRVAMDGTPDSITKQIRQVSSNPRAADGRDGKAA